MAMAGDSRFMFDFLVLYADEDLSWVEDFVTKVQNETKKRGYYKDGPDSPLGGYGFDNVEKALDLCERTFIILSEHTNHNEQVYFEGLNALEKYLAENKKENRSRIVPVIRRGGQLPQFLRVFSKMEETSKYFWKNIYGTVRTPVAVAGRGASSLAYDVQNTEVSSSTLTHMNLQLLQTDNAPPTSREYYDGCDSLR